MLPFTLHELQCFDAVVNEGSFQAAADKLHRSHPTVFTSVKNLESRLGLALLDRSGYRVALTEEGLAFHKRVHNLLTQAAAVGNFAGHLASGEESDLHIVLGPLCPIAPAVVLLKRFFDTAPQTRLHLLFESLSGPCERLIDEEADLVFHPVSPRDTRFDTVALCKVELVPVVAPGFLPFVLTDAITPEDMRPLVQCIVRDTGRVASRDYFVLEGARSVSVASQDMKKEVIASGMAWGHLPAHLIGPELRDGQLLSIEGQHFRRTSLELCAARLHGRSQGPVASRLWEFLCSAASYACAAWPEAN